MKRALIVLGTAALTFLGLVGPAGAAAGKVTHIRISGPYAQAEWASVTDSTLHDTFVDVSNARQGPELFVYELTGEVNADGNLTGPVTETIAQVRSGFSFIIDRLKLTAASLTASGVPATSCTFTFNGGTQTCTATTISVSATWAGEGPITRGVRNEHFKTAGVVSTHDHINGTSRNATATGMADDLTLNASDLGFATLGNANSGTTIISIGAGVIM